MSITTKKVIRCDRCGDGGESDDNGEIIALYGDYAPLQLTEFNFVEETSLYREHDSYHLCRKCADAFSEWIRSSHE